MAPIPAAVSCLLFLSLAVGSFAAGPFSNGEADWPTYHGGYSLDGAARTAPGDDLRPVWEYVAGSPVSRPPVAGEGKVFFADDAGLIHALDRGGRRIWSRSLPSLRAPLLYARGSVVVGSTAGNLYALDAATGRERWRYRLGANIQASANLAAFPGKGPAVVAVSQPLGVLHLVDLSSGKAVWVSRKTDRCDGPAATGPNLIAFGNCAAAVHILSAGRGEEVAVVPLGEGGEVYGGVALAGDLVFAGDRSGRIHAVDPGRGKILWTRRLSRDAVSATPAVAGDLVIAASDGGMVFALARATGKEVWRFDTGSLPESPVIAGDRVLVSSGGSLFLLGLSDGRRIRSYPVSDRITSPALAGGLVLVGTDEGRLLAFGPARKGEGGPP